MMEKVITAQNFEEEVLKSEKPILVDFWASWCAPCRAMAPVLEEVAAERPDVKVVKVNVEGSDEMKLAQTYRVTGIPTLAVFRDGERVKTSVGVVPKEKVLELL